MISIAIDGPAGAGKSTLAKSIASALDIHYLDTGAMYRAFAWYVLDKKRDPGNRHDVVESAKEAEITVEFSGGMQRVLAAGKDVTDLIRTPVMSRAASDVSAFQEVREKLVSTQRKVAKKYDIVMDGRDIGTHVLPDANHKFYITASSSERARRRGAELSAQGYDVDIAALEREINERDKNDMTRKFAPLMQAPDAELIDTTEMDAEAVLAYVISRIKSGIGRRH